MEAKFHLLRQQSPEPIEHQLSEPPEASDYEKYPQPSFKWLWQCVHAVPWMLCLTLLVLFVLERNKQGPTAESFWRPYELEGAKRELPMRWKEVEFTGGLSVVDGQLLRVVDPTLPAYVGSPTPEMDALWDKLIMPLNLFVTVDEAMAMGTQEMSVEPESGLYIAMPQGLHDLHCLNFLRKALYLEYYPEQNTSTLQVHTEHCIDSLRQSFMCTSDMTIIREYWSEKDKHLLANFNNVHTCRDFDAIREWSNDRNGQDDGVWPGVAQRLKGDHHH